MPVITTKELGSINDQLAIEQNLISKYKTYAQTTSDVTLKNKYEQIAKKHEGHYDSLFTYLTK